MPRHRSVDVPLAGLTVTDARERGTLDLGDLRGVHVMVLMRHRH